jgi:uncharacterized protein (UPF0262 family)
MTQLFSTIVYVIVVIFFIRRDYKNLSLIKNQYYYIKQLEKERSYYYKLILTPMVNFINHYFEDCNDVYNSIKINKNGKIEITLTKNDKTIKIDYLKILENPIECLEKAKLDLQ